MSAAPTVTAVQVSTPQGPRALPAVVDLVAPLPGLPGHDRYELEPLDEIGVLFALRSADDGSPVRLFVVAPHAFFPDYAPRLGPLVADDLGADEADLVLLVVVRPSDDGEPPTANLLAPIVLDGPSGRAQQVVLDDDLPVRAPVG